MIIDCYLNKELMKLVDVLKQEYLSTNVIRKSSVSKLESAISCMVLNCYNQAKSGSDQFVVTLREEDYSKPIIINGIVIKSRKVSYTYVKLFIQWLVENKGCKLELGGYVVGVKNGEVERTCSVFVMCDALLDMVLPYVNKSFLKLDNVVELRNNEKEPMPFKRTRKVDSLVSGMNKYNRNTTNFVVESKDGLVYDVQARKVFNKSFDLGGRMYLNGGSVQTMDREDRIELTIDGEPTVEIDYKGLHPRILYTMKGIDYSQENPYTIEIEGYCKDWLKKVSKIALLIMFNTKSKQGAIKAVENEIVASYNVQKLVDKHKIPNLSIDFSAIVSALEKKHYRIKEYLYSDIGPYLQNRDSLIMDHIVGVFTQHKELAIPIHDSIIIKEKLQDFGCSVMEEAFATVLGDKQNCVLEIKKRGL